MHDDVTIQRELQVVEGAVSPTHLICVRQTALCKSGSQIHSSIPEVLWLERIGRTAAPEMQAGDDGEKEARVSVPNLKKKNGSPRGA
jgi:hypothetical protein